MTLKQGNTYKIKTIVTSESTDDEGNKIEVPIDIEKVAKVVFQLGEIRKVYPSEVEYDDVNGWFVIKIEQDDTLKLDTKFEYEIAVLYKDEECDRSEVETAYSLETIIDEVITNVED